MKFNDHVFLLLVLLSLFPDLKNVLVHIYSKTLNIFVGRMFQEIKRKADIGFPIRSSHSALYSKNKLTD